MNHLAIAIKANSKYTCQQCGVTELIQAHHEIPGDDASLICLCAECHSQKHPTLPKALFFNKRNQPYWLNKSASSIAREMAVHPRTVIRAARRLQILAGHLSPFAEESLKKNIHIRRHKLKGSNKYWLKRHGRYEKSLEVTFPYEVVEREARRRGMTVDEFIKQFVTQVEYNGAPTVVYTFVEGQTNQSEQ